MSSEQAVPANADATRNGSISQDSQLSQTAQEFINAQLQLEEDAREALPYQFDTCTNPLGPLRQTVFSCLTCRPPPEDPSQPYDAAGVCYSCSISCHGDHELVELFTRRNFVCDCGTTRLPKDSPCTLRLNPDTGKKGSVHSQEPSATNRYNQNFRNRFCGCSEVYDPHTEKATMFQCIGLGNVEDGGCGEDWWHPECIVGLPRDWYKKAEFQAFLKHTKSEPSNEEEERHIREQNGAVVDEDPPLPMNFPDEDDFEHFICYKCLEAFPWIKRYATAPGFMCAQLRIANSTSSYDECPSTPVALSSTSGKAGQQDQIKSASTNESSAEAPLDSSSSAPLKRKAEDDEKSDDGDMDAGPAPKKIKSQGGKTSTADAEAEVERVPCRCKSMPPSPRGLVSFFLGEDFRDQLCRCPECFPSLSRHPQLLEEEENYEPPLSTSSANPNGSQANGNGTQSVGSRSLLDRGEAALSSMDRVRAIEGVMVYNHLRDKVKDFLKPFAESGTAVGAEDIKKYFEKLRGDEEAIKAAAAASSGDANARNGGSGNDGGESSDARKEQRGQ